MKKSEEKSSLHYLSDWGWGKGSNFNTGNVCGLMERYHEIKSKSDRGKIEKLEELLKEAHRLIGHPATNISGSVDMACDDIRTKIEEILNIDKSNKPTE